MSNSELIQKKSNKYDVLAPNDHDHESCTPVYSVTPPKTAHKYYGIINKGNKCVTMFAGLSNFVVPQ